MRFHVLGIPHTITNNQFSVCAFTQLILQFCKMMYNRGHHIMHYGHEDSNPLCNENISVVTDKIWKSIYKHNSIQDFKFDDVVYEQFYKNTINEIYKRKKKNDFILAFWGVGHKPICDEHNDLITVEPTIGYGNGTFAKYRVFPSYAHYHCHSGLNIDSHFINNVNYTVIPHYFDLDNFKYSDKKEDYVLFMGRVCDSKGIDIAMKVTDLLDIKLVVAGQLGHKNKIIDKVVFTDNVEYLGTVGVKERKELMSKAKATIIPSIYSEPFGMVQVESLLSGTPIITTDWGAFTEVNLNGITGYRCQTFNDFIDAIKNIDKINSEDCRKQGEKFSFDNIAPMYEKYFNEILNEERRLK